jgi:hypothetical protein
MDKLILINSHLLSSTYIMLSHLNYQQLNNYKISLIHYHNLLIKIKSNQISDQLMIMFIKKNN